MASKSLASTFEHIPFMNVNVCRAKIDSPTTIDMAVFMLPQSLNWNWKAKVPIITSETNPRNIESKL